VIPQQQARPNLTESLSSFHKVLSILVVANCLQTVLAFYFQDSLFNSFVCRRSSTQDQTSGNSRHHILQMNDNQRSTFRDLIQMFKEKYFIGRELKESKENVEMLVDHLIETHLVFLRRSCYLFCCTFSLSLPDPDDDDLSFFEMNDSPANNPRFVHRMFHIETLQEFLDIQDWSTQSSLEPLQDLIHHWLSQYLQYRNAFETKTTSSSALSSSPSLLETESDNQPTRVNKKRHSHEPE